MSRNYSNIALDTTLTAGIAAGDLSCVVASASGWPAAPFAAVLDPGLAAEEVVQVTAKVGTTFTITRGFDGTTAAAHALGAVVRHAAIAGDFTDLQTADTSEASTRATDDATLAGLITTEAGTRASADSAHAALTTGAHGGIVASTDARLTDARTPTAHAATHASAGSDPVTLAQSQVTGLAAALALLAPLASPTLTGIPAAPTAGLGTNTTQLATTAFVLANAGGGSVTSVTASAPLASSGGATPDISFTGTLATTLGGTGVNNAGTLTNPSNTAITGGGTLALGGFTLTVPATGSAALLGTANVFTAAQTINGANLGIALTGAASGGTPSIVASSPAQITTAVAGTPLQITASPAIAGSSTVGAAVGGNVNITAGAAARLTSGNARGGEIFLTPGAGIGTGLAGSVLLPQSAAVTQGNGGIAFGANATDGTAMNIQAFNTNFNFFSQNLQVGRLGYALGMVLLSTSGGYSFSSGVGNDGARDLALARDAAGVVQINTGTAGQWGAIKAGKRDAGTTTITDGLTLGHQSTGTPAAGLGIGIQLNVNSSTTADQNAARLTASWSDATHATLTSLLSVYTRTGGAAQAERLRVDAGDGVAGNTGLMIWDLDNNTLERVTVGIADSGGIGFKLLCIPN